MSKLSNDLLIDTFYKSIEFGLKKEFVDILLEEIEYRGIKDRVYLKD